MMFAAPAQELPVMMFVDALVGGVKSQVGISVPEKEH